MVVSGTFLFPCFDSFSFFCFLALLFFLPFLSSPTHGPYKDRMHCDINEGSSNDQIYSNATRTCKCNSARDRDLYGKGPRRSGREGVIRERKGFVIMGGVH